MSEDYTYPTTPTLADLRARVAELERQLAQADSNMVALAARNAELAARLDAVPVPAIRRIVFDDKRSFGVIRAEQTVAGWLATFDTQPAQPDDTDAPLTLAKLDEDGDE